MSLKTYFPVMILWKQALAIYWKHFNSYTLKIRAYERRETQQAGKGEIGYIEGSSQINVRLVGSTAEPTGDDASLGKRNEWEPTVGSGDGGGGGLGSSPLG